MEEPDETPHPRTPPTRSFDQLAETGIVLEAEKYASSSKNAPRYDAYDYAEEKNEPRWSDEKRFHDWLVAAALPRELAEMLYAHAPEVSFLLGPGHIAGVEDIIERNPPESALRQAGFFQLARGPNGDSVVIALGGKNPGEVGYLPHGALWGMNADEMRETFIPIIGSIGEFFEAFENEAAGELPRDYYDAKDRRGG